VIVPALAFLDFGFGSVVVCPTSDVARNNIAHIFHAAFITLSYF
jgi:hypothetical protein